MTEESAKGKLTLSGKSTLTLKNLNKSPAADGKKVVQVEVRKKRVINQTAQAAPKKEIDEARLESGVDYKRDVKLATQLMKRYSAFTLMIADDAAQRIYMLNDADDISWNVVPFSAIIGKDTGDQLTSALAKLGRIQEALR